MMRLPRLVLLVVVLCTFSRGVSADPIQMSGFVFINVAEYGLQLNLGGTRDFQFYTTLPLVPQFFPVGPLTSCLYPDHTCALDGAPIDLTVGTIDAHTLDWTTFIVDGVDVPRVPGNGLLFRVYDAVVPFPTDAPPGDPIQLRGNMQYAVLLHYNGREELFQWRARAFVNYGLVSDPSEDPRYRLTTASYALDPIPEPATLLLLGTGFVALGRRWRGRVA